MSDWFEVWSNESREFVRGLRQRGAWNYFQQNLVDAYPDPTHFVYELLQNAEDQAATSVKFELYDDRLTFRHNGLRDRYAGEAFTREDVKSITNLASTKAAKDRHEKASNTIGKFGIGFKSVFGITDRPEIYTTLEESVFAFAIEDLFVPIRIEYDNMQAHYGETLFIFPFQDDRKKNTYDKILQKLTTLGADTMLFLDCISEITWKTSYEEGLYLCQRERPNKHKLIPIVLIEERGPLLAAPNNRKRKEVGYLQSFKKVSMDISSDELTVRIAFRVENGRIVPEPGEVKLDVYFPTEEQTHLKFRMHAPMLLNPTRTNIKKDNRENELLINEAAHLLATTLPRLREAGYLDVACLCCLPIERNTFINEWWYDNLEEIRPNSQFSPLFMAGVNAFKENDLLPSDNGSRMKSSQAIMAETPALRMLLTPEQVTTLYTVPTTLYWLSDEIKREATETALLWNYCRRDLKVTSVDAAGFAAKLSEEFFTQQTDDWMIRFYDFLEDQRALWKPGGALRNKPFIRLENGRHMKPFDEAGALQVYLPSLGATGYPTVKGVFVEQSQKLLSLLEVRQPNITDEAIQKTLKRYTNGSLPKSNDEYYQDLQTIAHAVSEAKLGQERLIKNELANAPFVLSVNAADGSKCYRKPEQTLVHSEQLWAWYEGNSDAWFIDDTVYGNSDFKKILSSLRGLLQTTISIDVEQADVRGYVELSGERHQRNYKRGLDRFDPNAMINGLEYALENLSAVRAQLLWKLLLSHSYLVRGKVESSTRASFDPSQTKEIWSKLGELCQKFSWLPKANGSYYPPSQIGLDDLPEGYENTTERSVELARQFRMNNTRRSPLEAVAASYGVEHDVVKKMLSWLADAKPGEVEHFLNSRLTKRVKPAFPTAPATNPERRALKVEARALTAEPIRFERREISQRVSSSEDPDPYLRSMYTNENEEMICQICEQSMPFKRSDGQYYFEAVQCVKATGVIAEYRENRLALCPVCAAKYKYVNDLEPKAIYELVLESDNPAVHIILAGEKATVRFVDLHWRDIKYVFTANEKRAEQEAHQ